MIILSHIKCYSCTEWGKCDFKHELQILALEHCGCAFQTTGAECCSMWNMILQMSQGRDHHASLW